MNKIPKQKNVLGEDIEPCSMNPVTGWFRDGSCNTDKTDVGMHCVCAKVTDDFLVWCKENGNDLITPHPEFGFEGLKDGDNWCVCASCCLLYTSPSPRDRQKSRMPSSA